ncbi:MAG: glycosyltransferase [Patescibacteria group bacterium]
MDGTIPELSIIIPAYNEEERLGKTLEALIAFLHHHVLSWEILVVDDGSTDNTLAVARAFSDAYPVRTLRYEQNRGKGYALRTGVGSARGKCIATYDADAAIPVEDLYALYVCLIDGGYDMVIASRFEHKNPAAVRIPLHRFLLGRIYAALCRPLVPGIRDCSCGCKVYRGDVARALFR